MRVTGVNGLDPHVANISACNLFNFFSFNIIMKGIVEMYQDNNIVTLMVPKVADLGWQTLFL